MANKKLRLHIENLLDKIFPTPIVVTACVAIIIFYSLYLRQNSIEPRLVFLFFVIFLLFSLTIYLVNFCIKKILNKKIVFFVAGVLIGFYSFLQLLTLNAQVLTLADLSDVDCIKFVLRTDAIPSGAKYYSADATLLNCAYNEQNKIDKTAFAQNEFIQKSLKANFSACGNIKVFFPIDMVKQNNAFSITLFKSESENACRNFSNGAIILAYGKFGKKADITSPNVFFVTNQLPEFLGWNSFLDGVRAKFRFILMHLLAGWGQAGGLLLALISSNKDFLEISCSTSFRNAGLSHILALSGMHVSLVSLSAIRLGSLFGKKTFAIKFSLISIVLFVWFAGSAPSLNRALGMMIILVIGNGLGLRPNIISVLSAMLIFHIVLKPTDALSLGFMLSYGALAGILLFGEAIVELFDGKIPCKILSGVSASIGAQSFTAPVVIGKIGTLAPIGVVSSLIVSPIVSAFLLLGMVSVPISLIFPFTNRFFNFVLNLIYKAILSLSKSFAMLPLFQVQSIWSKIVFSTVPIVLGLILIQVAYSFKQKREVF